MFKDEFSKICAWKDHSRTFQTDSWRNKTSSKNDCNKFIFDIFGVFPYMRLQKYVYKETDQSSKSNKFMEK